LFLTQICQHQTVLGRGSGAEGEELAGACSAPPSQLGHPQLLAAAHAARSLSVRPFTPLRPAKGLLAQASPLGVELGGTVLLWGQRRGRGAAQPSVMLLWPMPGVATLPRGRLGCGGVARLTPSETEGCWPGRGVSW